MSESKFTITVEEMFLDNSFLSLFEPTSIASYKKHGKLVTKVKKSIIKELETVYEEVKYIAGSRYKKPCFELGQKRFERIAKQTNYANCGSDGSNKQEYKKLSAQYIEGMVSKLDGYHTWYNVLYELELFHRKTGKVDNGRKYLGSVINRSLDNNRQFFYSYQPFQLFYKVYNSSFTNKLWLNHKPQLVNHFRDELISRGEKIFEDWIADTKANYEKVYIANVKKIDSDREHFSINTVHITEEELSEYKKWYAIAKDEKLSEAEIMELCREKFGFNYAYAMYRFFNNDHLPVVLENANELRQQIRDDLMSVLVNLSATRNHTRQNEARKKEEVPTYDEKFSLGYEEDSWSLSFIAERMATDQWFYKLKRSREYLKIAHQVFGDVLEPSGDLRISTTKLKAKPAGLPEYFSVYRGRFSFSEEETPTPFEVRNNMFAGAKHRKPQTTTSELFNTIKDIFDVERIPFEWRNMIAILRNGDSIFSESLYSEIGWVPEDSYFPDISLYGGKAKGYSFDDIQKAFKEKEWEIKWAQKNKEFSNDTAMFLYCLEIVIDQLGLMAIEKKCALARKHAEKLAEMQMNHFISDENEEFENALAKYREPKKEKRNFFDEW